MDEQELLALALDAFIKRAQDVDYDLYHDYYNGDHRLRFATNKFNNAFAGTFREFALNICPTVVDTFADRMLLEGFDILDDAPETGAPGDAAGNTTGVEAAEPSDTPASERLAAEEPSTAVPGRAQPTPIRPEVTVEADPRQAELRAIWEHNRMDQRQHEVHHEMFKCGDAYVIVWPDITDPLDPSMPIIWPQEAGQIIVGHNVDNPNLLDWGLKVWLTDAGQLRVTLYTKEFIYKYVSTGKVTNLDQVRKDPGSYERYQPELEPGVPKEQWPIPNPYGRIPIFPFRNNVGGEIAGRSELRDVIPIQDAVNKTLMDMIVGQEYYSLPQRWATGIEVETDENGNPTAPFETATGKLWTTANADVSFGQFPSSDISMLQDNADKLIQKISVIARIPLHYITPISGDRWPSGESLKTAEAPFTAKVTDRMASAGNDWEDVFQFCLEVRNQPGVRLSARWKDPNPRAEAEQIEQFEQLATIPGIPLPLAAQMAGMDPKFIAALEAAEAEKQRLAEEQRQQQLAMLEQRQQQNQNQPPSNQGSGGNAPARDGAPPPRERSEPAA